jgi:hypothetical protein
MKKLALFTATVVCLISFYGMNAYGQVITRYLGPSGGTINGAGTLARMNTACQTTYGTAAAHMCDVDVFFATATVPGQNRTLWIQPAVHNCVWNGTETMCEEAGATAQVSESNAHQTCNSTPGPWTSASGFSGTTVSFTTGADAVNGWVLNTSADCSVANQVACCQSQNP